VVCTQSWEIGNNRCHCLVRCTLFPPSLSPMYLAFLAQVLLGALLVSAASPTRTLSKRQPAPPSKFVTAQNGHFMVNGRFVPSSIYLSPESYRIPNTSTLGFVGTNAYWLPSLNSDEDIDFTLGNMSAAGIKVIRTWAFNGVFPALVLTWFEVIDLPFRCRVSPRKWYLVPNDKQWYSGYQRRCERPSKIGYRY